MKKLELKGVQKLTKEQMKGIVGAEDPSGCSASAICSPTKSLSCTATGSGSSCYGNDYEGVGCVGGGYLEVWTCSGN